MTNLLTDSYNVPPPTLYSRGFLFTVESNHILEALPHYHHVYLPGYHLYIDEVVEYDIAVDGKNWIAIVGKVLPLSTGQLLPNDESIAATMLNSHNVRNYRDYLEETLYDLGGRYAIAVNVNGTLCVYNDATASRSVFFDVETGSISSHFALLEDSRVHADDPVAFPDSVRDELQWNATRNPAIGALIANMRLNVATGKQERFFPLSKNTALDLGHSERIALAEKLWSEQVELMVSTGLPLGISLSGGLDSRLMLAMIRDRKDQFRSMTYTSESALRGGEATTKWGKVMQNDYRTVVAMREFLPKDHTYIPRRADRWTRQHAEVLNKNATGNHGRWILPGYLSIFGDRRSIHYRGNLLEIGRLSYGAARKGVSQKQRILEIARSKIEKEGASDYLVSLADSATTDLGYDRIDDSYQWTDIYYWEIRHSRWYAQVLNETDVAFDTITPFNARRIIDLFLAYNLGDRRSGFFQKELIYRNNPFLMFLGVNEATDLYRKFISEGNPS